MTKATITGHLYNLTFHADLLNRNSARFKSLEKHFCDDVSRVYLNSFLFLTYRGCQIEHFSPSPNEVKFNLFFDAKVSNELEWGITYVLTNDSPKVNLTLNDLHLVEVLHLGDLFLTLREITLVPTPSTSLPMPSTSSISPTTLTSMSSTPTPTMTSSPDVVTSTVVYPTGTNVTVRYPLFNFTYLVDLGDPPSDTFEQYQRLLCLEIQEVFKASRIFYLLYDGCGINSFGFDENGLPYIDFHMLFNTGFTDMLFKTTVDTLEKSRVHLNVTVNGTRVIEILPIGGLLLILENRTASSSAMTSSMTQTVAPTDVPSTSVTTTSVRYGGLIVALYYETYELGYTTDLEDTNSPRFQLHRKKVCSDLERWFHGLDSPFYLTYHGCELTSFSSNPEGVTFTLTLRTEMTRDIARHVRTFLEYKAPKKFVPRYNLLEVGDLDLIADRYTIDVTPIPFPSDSYTVYTSLPPSSSETISMTSTSIEPTPTSSAMPSSSTDFPLMTAVSLKFGLADFVFTDDLNYEFSQLYRYLQDTFCADIEQFYRNSTLSSYYRTCQIDEFVESPPNQPHKVTFTLLMEMPYNQELVDLTIDTLLAQEPQIIRDGYVTIRVGELYLILTDWSEVSPPSTSRASGLPTLTLSSTYANTPTPTTLTPTIRPTPTSSAMESSTVIFTTPSTTTVDPTYYLRMSFELENITWTPDLNVTTSEPFRRHNNLFCAELNEFLPGQTDKDFSHYMRCNIEKFNNQPMRVNFSLQFDTLEGLNIDRVQRLVISFIKEHAIRHTVGNLMVYQIGDLLIDLDSVYIHNDTSITTVNLFDAIAYEHRYSMFPGNFTQALLDKTSYEFKTRSFEFCKDIDTIFSNVGIRNVRERFLGCYVNKFSNGPSPSVTFTITFNGIDVIDPERLNGIIVFSKQREGETYFPIGDVMVTSTADVTRYFLMLDMLSTHAYPYTTTPIPAVYTYVEIKLRALTPSWTQEFADPSSAYYQQMVNAFCDDVSRWIKAEKQDYIGCKVLRINNNPLTIEAELKFSGQQTSSLRYEVDTIMLESPDWEIFGNVIGLKMGKFYIYEESLVLDQRTGPAKATTSSGTAPSTTPSTPPTPTRPSNPCLLGGDFYRHPKLCDRFLQCAGDLPIEIPCGPGSVFLDMACKTPTPGFECTPLPG
ncbi:mucin-16-like [Littorina saxatilis]|uniref:mucin-16-like n=1 Tax=Littorina saxatilis TaxID=31220 RepID=UPI0038B64692